MRVLLLLSAFLMSTVAVAQQQSLLLKTKPPTFLMGTLDEEGAAFGEYKRLDITSFFNTIGVEKVVSYHSSFQLMGNYMSLNDVDGFSFSGISVMPAYRYYFKGEAPKGFYSSIYMMYTQIDVLADIDFSGISPYYGMTEVSSTLKYMASGLHIGNQFSFGRKSKMMTDIFLGVQLRNTSAVVEELSLGIPQEQHAFPQITKPFLITAGVAFSYYLFQ